MNRRKHCPILIKYFNKDIVLAITDSSLLLNSQISKQFFFLMRKILISKYYFHEDKVNKKQDKINKTQKILNTILPSSKEWSKNSLFLEIVKPTI